MGLSSSDDCKVNPRPRSSLLSVLKQCKERLSGMSRAWPRFDSLDKVAARRSCFDCGLHRHMNAHRQARPPHQPEISPTSGPHQPDITVQAT